MDNPAYSDLSFIMQTLDNSDTIGEVDPALIKAWADEEKIVAPNHALAVTHLYRCITELQLSTDPTHHGSSQDRITIHRGRGAFAAQFFIDVHDTANRPSTILCYGRTPRAIDKDSDRRELGWLKEFLRRQDVKLTPSIASRYRMVSYELARASEPSQPGLPLFGRKLLRPNLRGSGIFGGASKDEPVVRLGEDSPPESPDSSTASDDAQGTSDESEEKSE